ncbi:MAG TPA: VWA domain-containing protein [Thermoanaerobaculia bacterium]|nr:VWA domain-containing protein [Thermoanaerobaculia bacterium]
MIRPTLSALLSIILVAAPAVSQQPRPQQPVHGAGDVFSEVIEVRAVNVQVVVTDRRGNRVPGLPAEDFRILLDGKEVPLDYFAEVREGRIAMPAGAGQSEKALAGLPPGLHDVGAGEVVGTNYLIFIDELFSPVHLRSEALKVMAGGADKLREQDRMAIVAFNGRDLRVLSDWASPATLKELFRKLAREKRSLTGIGPPTNPLAAAKGPWLEPLGAMPGQDVPDPANERDVEAQATRQKDGSSLVSPDLDVMEAGLEVDSVKHVVAAATATVRGFSASTPPGRRVMLLLSGGWSFNPASFYANADFELAKRMLQVSWDSGYRVLRPLIDASNLLGYTIYPVHLAEPGSMLQSAEMRQSGAYESMFLMDQHLHSQSSLASVAVETGGRLLVPGARHLQRVEEDTSSYYWLGFSQSGGDDKRRNLKVEVRRKGLNARARSSFLPLSRSARASIDVETALTAGGVPNAGPLNVDVGTPRRSGLAAMELPVSVRIPVEQITLLQEGGRHLARLELRVASLDRGGRRSEIPVLPIVISKDQPPKRGMVVVYDVRLKLRRDAQDLQLVLHDLYGGTDLAARVRVVP